MDRFPERTHSTEQEQRARLKDLFDADELKVLGEIPEEFADQFMEYIERVGMRIAEMENAGKYKRLLISTEELYKEIFEPWIKTGRNNEQLLAYTRQFKKILYKRLNEETLKLDNKEKVLEMYAKSIDLLLPKIKLFNNFPVTVLRTLIRRYMDSNTLNSFWNGKFGEA